MTSGTRSLPFDRPRPFSPPAAYEELRRDAPIARVLTAHGESAWMVTGWEGVKQVLSDPRLGVTPPDADPADIGSLFCDGQDHARLRRLVSRAFTARTLDGLRPRIHELGDSFVTDLVTAGPGADLVESLARPLPLTVVCEILGIRVNDRDRFHDWADAALGLAAPTVDIGQAEGYGQAWDELAEFLGSLIATKREAPGKDLLSVLVAIRDADDGRLSDTELLTTAVALLTAGYLTTANALSIGIIKLLEVDGRADLSDDQEAVARAVEESCATRPDAPPRQCLAGRTLALSCTANRSPPATWSWPAWKPLTTTRSGLPTPIGSILTAHPTRTLPSGTARTTASAPPWLASSSPPRSPRWPAASPRWHWPARRRTSRGPAIPSTTGPPLYP